ncbi:hypothetical protein ACFQZQ_11710 [Lysobacter koreensis]|uniref:SH3 domain-containing protein n=1 Tax=Lysobacter koreensis TaxID=266122 RepID=A0ABW2YTS2_9GAMM
MRVGRAALGALALAALAALAWAAWWLWLRPPRAPAAGAASTITHAACALPPRVAPGDAPRQSAPPSTLAPFRAGDATLAPLAGFSIDARVLSRRDYAHGREGRLAPTDLALGWGRMRDDAVLAQLEINQAGRWYHYRWRGDDAPIPPPEITRSSANMHLIPADKVIARALDAVDEGQRVRIDGWLVDAQSADGWRWRSSTSREDTGAGGCEIVYVCAITRVE